MASVLIKNARLVDPQAGLDGRFDLLAVAGRVRAVQADIDPAEARAEAGAECLSVVDADGLWLWPGLIDPHVHLREPGFEHKETFATGGAAAVAGGYTAVICEPNTDPPLDSVPALRRAAHKAQQDAPLAVYFKATMTAGRRGQEPSDIAGLAAEPSVVALSDDGDPVVAATVMAEVCRLAAEHRILLAPHCEDSPRALEDFAAGVDAGFAPAGPYCNEANYIRRDMGLAGRADCRIHFSHVSLGAAVEIIEAGQAAGACTYEATPHHLLLSVADFPPGEVPKVNPPLRPAADRQALRNALIVGRADMLASDHAPHTAEDKAAGASGFVGLETTLGLVLTHFVWPGLLSPADAVRLMSVAPARVFGLPGGTLAPGVPADMVLIDPDIEWVAEPEVFLSRSRNTPFAGWQLRGMAVATYVDGRPVHQAPDSEGHAQGTAEART